MPRGASCCLARTGISPPAPRSAETRFPITIGQGTTCPMNGHYAPHLAQGSSRPQLFHLRHPHSRKLQSPAGEASHGKNTGLSECQSLLRVKQRCARGWRVFGGSKGRPRRRTTHPSIWTQSIGSAGPIFYMKCSKTSSRPRFHLNKLATNVPTGEVPCNSPILQRLEIHTPLVRAQILTAREIPAPFLPHS